MKMHPRLFLFTLLFSVISYSTQAQSSVKDFLLDNSATIISDECIRLTPDIPYVSGSAWYKKAIDLNMPFEMVICLVLGEKDLEGADGITFVFHPRIQTGFRGEGMGFGGLRPSLGLEFDTYQNYHLNDPVDDHLAVMINGQTFHGFDYPPINLTNLEDGGRHRLRITWDPEEKKLDIYLDGELQLGYSADLVGNVFGGNSKIYWGVTAATGRLSNFQDICIKKLIFAEAIED